MSVICVGTVAFTAEEVRDIRARWLRMESGRAIAKAYRVSPWTIKELARRGWR